MLFCRTLKDENPLNRDMPVPSILWWGHVRNSITQISCRLWSWVGNSSPKKVQKCAQYTQYIEDEINEKVA